MGLIVTPRQLSHFGEFYDQLARLISAGIGLIQGLENIRKTPPNRAFRAPIERVLALLNQGYTLSQAVEAQGRWLPGFDIALIQAGEQSGRLDASFTLLAGYYKERASLARQIISDLAYPLFILHFAVLVFPTTLLTNLVWQNQVSPFLWAKLSFLVPLYGGTFLLVFACQGRHGESWRAGLERVTAVIPFVGRARQALALARLSAGLGALIQAGVTIIEAWQLAAAVSGSPAMRRAVIAAKPRVVSGETPGEVLGDMPMFPDVFVSLYRTGETSGKLDDALNQLHKYYQEEASRKLKAVAQWFPRLIYLAILLGIAWQVVRFYQNYFGELGKVLGS